MASQDTACCVCGHVLVSQPVLNMMYRKGEREKPSSRCIGAVCGGGARPGANREELPVEEER